MSTTNPSSSDEREPLLPRDPQPSVLPPNANAQPLVTRTPATPAAPAAPGVVRSPGTNSSWPPPAGLPMRGPNDENLVIFRHAVGINFALQTSDGATLEEGRKTATGIYRAVLREQKLKSWQHFVLNILVYICHVAQILIGAVLTALGPAAAEHALVITVLGACNTVIAGVLALIKGQGLPERLRKDELEYRKLQDWIEETEKLLAVGIIGKDRREVGMLVEVAFKKYNAAKASEENNRPDAYVRQREEGPERDDDGEDDSRSHGSGNAIVRLNIR